MSLVIVVPTYQRPDALVWSLESVFRQKFGKVDFKKKVFIVNSDPATEDAVQGAVVLAINNAGGHEFDEVSVVPANNALPTAKKIYWHLKDLTNEGDIGIVHCDDDIMFPNTLLNRYQATVNAPQSLCIAETAWACFFIEKKKGIFFSASLDAYKRGQAFDYQKAVKEDISVYPLPFISVYAYKMVPAFWKVYEEAISWSDELPFDEKIKYPFVPYFMGLAAFSRNELAVSREQMCIRGQIFALRKILPPKTVTDYSNGGLIMMTGSAILNNEHLADNRDYDLIRAQAREYGKKHMLQSLVRRQGVTLKKWKVLYKLTKANYGLKDFPLKTILTNIRHVMNTVMFTQNLKQWFKGWGPEISREEFWDNWEKNNHR